MSFLSALTGALSSLFVGKAYAANAAIWGIYCSAFGPNCGEGKGFILDLAGRTATMVFQLVGGGAVIAVLYGAVKLITGGEGGKEEGKKIIQYALTGLVLAIMGWSIIWYVEGLVLSVPGV